MHHLGELDINVTLRQRMRQNLMGIYQGGKLSARRPYGLIDREAYHYYGAGRAHNAFGVQDSEKLCDYGILGCDECVGEQLHIIEKYEIVFFGA